MRTKPRKKREFRSAARRKLDVSLPEVDGAQSSVTLSCPGYASLPLPRVGVSFSFFFAFSFSSFVLPFARKVLPTWCAPSPIVHDMNPQDRLARSFLWCFVPMRKVFRQHVTLFWVERLVRLISYSPLGTFWRTLAWL
jgi:hypothetical protein